MFHLAISRPLLRYSHATLREQRTLRCVLTHLPTNRTWMFNSRRSAIAAMSAMTAALAEGNLSILPAVPHDAEQLAEAA